MKLSERYNAHRDQWKDCTLCSLCSSRRRTVFCRGSLPADVLFVGEAPGPQEDSYGRPFTGASGQILDRLIEETRERLLGEEFYQVPRPSRDFTVCITNAVLCYPGRDDKGNILAPKKENIQACQPRLLEFVKLVNPKLIVRLGNVAKSATKELVQVYPVRSLLHPSYIERLKENPSAQHLEFDRSVNRLSKWISELCT